jgi:hypothetical protein
MKRMRNFLAMGLLAVAATANAATFTFNEDLLAGFDPLDGIRQVNGSNQRLVDFNIATDVFAFDPDVFGGITNFTFVNDLTTNLPSTGFNTVVVQDPAPLNAGVAADRIAAALDDSGPGFFIYFNTSLDLPRLVYSRDLGSATADLAILARLTNLTGTSGFDQLPSFTAANFTATPEPSSFLLTGGALVGCGLLVRRRRTRA